MSLMSYLRFVLSDEADRDAFEENLASMLGRASSQTGYQWSEIGRDPWNDRKYVVVSEWDDVESVRAWERDAEHGAMMDRWEPHYGEEMVHRRFVPWVRPKK